MTDSNTNGIPDPARKIISRLYEATPLTFLKVAASYADQPAISDGTRSYNYGALRDAAQFLAAGLVEAGLQPGDTVLVSGPSSFGTIAAFIAAMLAGGILVSLDPTLPQDRQKQIVDLSEAKFAIFATASASANLPSLTAHPFSIPAWPDAAELAGLVTAHPPMPAFDVEASAYVFFTSGSTGLPKGVLGRHQGLAHFLDWQRTEFPLGPGDRSAQITALSFDVVLRDILYPLTSGACIHIPERSTVFDARKILAWMLEQRITILHSVPSLMKAWLQSDTSARPFRTLKYVFFAGEPLTDDLLNRFRSAASAQVQITNLYGPTETTLAKLYNRLTSFEPGIQPIGIPQPGVDVLILKDRKTLCGVGEIGEIAIRTPYRSKGYFKAPELTSEVFIQNPWSQEPGDWVYCTGDLGQYREDGKVQIFGRIDSQIKIRGVRIEPNEIEAHILKFPGVSNVAVTARLGDNQEKTLYAFVALSEPVDAMQFNRDMREFLKARLPEVMIPKRLIPISEIPHLPNGKVNRKALAELEIVEEAGGESGLNTDAMDEDSRQIVEGFEKALGYKFHDLDASFVDHGGDSLSYIQASLTVEKVLGWLPDKWDELSLKELSRLKKASRDSSLSINSTILARALSIVLIVLDHFKVIGTEIGVTSALFVIAGWSFGRYQINSMYKKDSTWSEWSVIAKIALPTALFVLVQQVATGAFHPSSLLFLDNFVDPYFDLQRNFSYYWFINVLLQMMVGMSLLFAIGSVRRYAFRNTFVFGLLGVAGAMAFGYLGIYVWDHFLGAWVQPTSDYVIGQLPHIRLWLFFLGIAIAGASTARQKYLLVAVVVVLFLLTRAIVRTPINISIASVPVVLLIILKDRVRIPSRLVPLISNIAGASLFIYLGHMVVYLHGMDYFKFMHPLLLSGITILASVWMWHVWEYVFPKTMGLVSSLLRKSGLSSGRNVQYQSTEAS